MAHLPPITPQLVQRFEELMHIGHTGFGGQSQSNEKRLGLRLTYTPARWTKTS